MAAIDWAREAERYRRQDWLERRALREVLRLLEPDTDEDLLDVATGPASLLAELAMMARPPRVAVGIDTSPEMLAQAPELPAGWELRVADATELPFADSSFDVATATYLLHLLEPDAKRLAIAELARVLRPGGRLGTVTVGPPRGPLGRLAWPAIQALARRDRGRMAALRDLDPGSELSAAGFREVSRSRTGSGYPSLCLVCVNGSRQGRG